jgi:hypothetical protein
MQKVNSLSLYNKTDKFTKLFLIRKTKMYE